ncbi:MAG: PadR family transcriptional regulator [Fervidicoccus sp.]|nr:MAG: PadR family transcriptional regulator [Fervidicoccus sp.]
MSESSTSRAFERLRKKLEGEVLWIYVSNLLLEENGLSVVELKKRLKEKFLISTKTVYLYTVLYRMEREGLIRRETREGKESVYFLENKGKESVYFLENKGKEVYMRGLEYLKSKLELLSMRNRTD